MSKGTYAERLSAYIHQLPTTTKNDLLVQVAVAIFNDEASNPTVKLATLARLEQLLSELRPELHTPYDREALTQALGEYLTEWWRESLNRPLTGRDLDQLLDRLPEYGIREALKQAAEQPGQEQDS